MPPAKKRNARRMNFDTFIKIVGLLLALGAPIVSLISMLSSYKDKQLELEKVVHKLSDDLGKIDDYNILHGESLEADQQTTMANSNTLLRMQQAQDNQNEKILELWKELAANTAKIDSMQTEFILLRNSQAPKK